MVYVGEQRTAPGRGALTSRSCRTQRSRPRASDLARSRVLSETWRRSSHRSQEASTPPGRGCSTAPSPLPEGQYGR